MDFQMSLLKHQTVLSPMRQLKPQMIMTTMNHNPKWIAWLDYALNTEYSNDNVIKVIGEHMILHFTYDYN